MTIAHVVYEFINFDSFSYEIVCFINVINIFYFVLLKEI